MAKKKVRVKKFPIFVLVVLIIGSLMIYGTIVKNRFKVELKTNILSIEELEENSLIEVEFKATYKGKDVTKDVKKPDNIYNGDIGKYQLVFTYVVKNKEYKVTKEIEIVNKKKPDIELTDGITITIILGTEFIEPGYKAISDYDGDLTDKVKISGSVDTKKEGTYTLTYTVEDSSKNKTTIKRTVIVTAKSPATMSVKEFTLEGYFPKVQLKETKDMGVEYSDAFIYAGDSTALYYVMNKAITGSKLWHKEGVTLEKIFTEEIYINHISSGMTLVKAVESKKPAKMLLMLGTNSAAMETDYFIKKYKELLNDLKKANPEMILIVQSIFPVSESYDKSNKSLNNDKINKMNFYLLELCNELSIPFLNTASALKNTSGTLKEEYYRNETQTPGVHLSALGNEVAMQYFRTHAYTN